MPGQEPSGPLHASAPAGVVLDFDGVIVRSMENHAEAYRRVLAPLGVRVRDRDVFLQEGARSETLIRDLCAAAGKQVTDAGVRRLAHEKQALYVSLGPPELYPGAAEMVRSLRVAASRVGLVTGTRRENVLQRIPDLVPLFDAILAQDAYHHDKPHAEPYEKSAAALGLAPARCAAIENAPRGVASARAAGFGLVVAISTTLPETDLRPSRPDHIVRDHAEATRLVLAWLCGRA